MFEKLLKSALDSGGEVVVMTKYCCDGIRGRVLDFDGECFSIFHSGTAGGMLWVYRVEDVACCALVVENPLPDEDLIPTLDEPTGLPTFTQPEEEHQSNVKTQERQTNRRQNNQNLNNHEKDNNTHE